MDHQYANRESFSSTASSVWVDSKDSSDWIAPCVEKQRPIAAAVADDSEDDKMPRGVSRRRVSSASEAGDVRELWECMLELQQRYGCYRSARMGAAISTYDRADLMPSKACLDLLNDSIVEEELPEEGWKQLEKHLPGLRQSRQQKTAWKFWKKR